MLTTKEKEALVNGLMKYAVLSSLSLKQKYGVELLKYFEKTPFKTQAGTLYPLLNRLHDQGHILYEWQESTAGPPRKYYKLSSRGKMHLKEIGVHWKKINYMLKEQK
jgi:PadR family transcriptional regulator PadR